MDIATSSAVTRVNTGDITTSAIVSIIKQQAYNNATLTFYYQILTIKVWAAGSVTGNRISLRDSESTAYELSDVGTVDKRPRVGYAYPPIRQKVRQSADDSTTIAQVSTTDACNCDLRISVKVWANATNF
jgi:hypothetical protein